MSRGRGSFTKSEVEAAVKGALDGGVKIGRVEIGKERIVITASGPGEPNCGDAETNEWDEVFDVATKTAIR